jgi:hypothetical protein
VSARLAAALGALPGQRTRYGVTLGVDGVGGDAEGIDEAWPVDALGMEIAVGVGVANNGWESVGGETVGEAAVGGVVRGAEVGSVGSMVVIPAVGPSVGGATVVAEPVAVGADGVLGAGTSGDVGADVGTLEGTPVCGVIGPVAGGPDSGAVVSSVGGATVGSEVAGRPVPCEGGSGPSVMCGSPGLDEGDGSGTEGAVPGSTSGVSGRNVSIDSSSSGT